MTQLFITDFIKNKSIQLMIILGFVADISASQSIHHVLILFGLPYLTSIILSYLITPEKVHHKWISEQYRPISKRRE